MLIEKWGGYSPPQPPRLVRLCAPIYGKSTKFIELAGEVNASMLGYVVSRITEALNEQGKPINGSKILIIGTLPINIVGSGNQDNRAYSNVSGKVGAGAYAILVNYQRSGSYDYSGSTSISDVLPFNYLWESNTTSECKVKFQFSSYASASATVYVPALPTQSMVVTLMEIGV